MEIVTGHRGTPHVTPYKVRDFNIGIVGAEDYVMNGGSELEAQLVSNNRIDIKDGSICMQGTHAVIPKNINDELTIENGMQGEKRIDLIVARYEKVADSGVESVNTVVLQGTPSKETPNVPGHVVGDIRNGDLKHEMPLYEVELDGINVVEVRPVFKKIVSAAEQQKMIELLNGNSYKLYTGLLGGMSTRPYVLKKYNDGTFELCGNLDASAVRLQYSNSSKVYFTTISAPIPEELTIDLDKRTQFSGSVESEGIYYLSANELTATTLTVYLSAMNYISEIHYIASGFILKGWWK